MMVIHLSSPDGSRDQLYISNYATLQVRDVLARVPGVGDIRVFGARDYAMRIWLDPDKIAARGLTAGDVVAALRAQNVQVASGVLNRSEEHTSELQSLMRISYAVFCLKKKKSQLTAHSENSYT